jgi:hypothetical protein
MGTIVETLMIKPLTHIALQGIQRSQRNAAQAASDIARYPVKGQQSDLNRSLLQLRQQENITKANVRTLETADKTLGTLLDELA